MREIHLKREERAVLLKKYVSSGMSEIDAKLRLTGIIANLNALVKRLRKKGKDEESINVRFKKEFEDICRRAEI